MENYSAASLEELYGTLILTLTLEAEMFFWDLGEPTLQSQLHHPCGTRLWDMETGKYFQGH